MGHTAVDLSPQIIAPMLYAYETIPSALSLEQIATVLKSTRDDQSPIGLRDYAILLLLSTYGLRVGEITRLRLDDIDWRADTLRIHHSKTGAHSLLPLMEPVGEALINYLRHGRPKTDLREIFIRTRAPYRPLSGPRFTRRSAGEWRWQALSRAANVALISSGMHAPSACCVQQSRKK